MIAFVLYAPAAPHARTENHDGAGGRFLRGIALERPARITAIISENGNASEEGLSEGWDAAAVRDFLDRTTRLSSGNA